MRKVNLLTVRMALRLIFPVTAFGMVLAIQPAIAQTNPPANWAIVAKPTASFVSEDTTVTALKDGFTPRPDHQRAIQTMSEGNRSHRSSSRVKNGEVVRPHSISCAGADAGATSAAVRDESRQARLAT